MLSRDCPDDPGQVVTHSRFPETTDDASKERWRSVFDLQVLNTEWMVTEPLH